MADLDRHPGGRPTKYRPEYCDEILTFCKEGFSITAFAGSIGVSRDTISEWAKTHPEFSASVKASKAASSFWWEKRGRIVGEEGGGPGTATMIIFNLKNMAPDDYRDKQEHEVSGPNGAAFAPPVLNVTLVKPNGVDGN